MRILLATLAVVCCLSTAKGQSASEARVLGYHAWWMADTWREYDLDLYDKLFFFELRLTEQGGIEDTYGWPERWTEFVSAVQAAGGRVAPTFAILDPVTFERLMTDPDRSRRAVGTIVDAVRAGRADGAHLNFEVFGAVDPAARKGLVSFVRLLRSDLKKYRSDAELTIFLPGFDHGETYDEAALAALADYIVVQGYDMHWLDAPNAGPVAPVAGWNGANWARIVERYLDLGIDRSRVVMTVPYFGYEWPTQGPEPGSGTRGTGEPITFAPVSEALLPLIRVNADARATRWGERRDPASDSPWYRYEGPDGWYQGWYEDARSLRSKYEFVRIRRLGGVAVFLLGYDAGRLEPELRRAFR